MNGSNVAEEIVCNGEAGISRCLCIPCAVTGRDFKERITETVGPWDGPGAPRAWINSRGYSLLYSPAPVKVRCARCGEEVHWAYHPETTNPSFTPLPSVWGGAR